MLANLIFSTVLSIFFPSPSSTRRADSSHALEPLHPSDTPDPKKLAAQLQTSLDSLRTELAGAESLMKALRRRISSIQETLDTLNIAEHQIEPKTVLPRLRRRNLTGFIHLLSEDVLILIFQEAMRVDPPKRSNFEIDIFGLAHRTLSPWNFASVCSRWRAVALSCPLLWKRITQRPEIASRIGRGVAELHSYRTTTQLRRSGTSPLIGRIDGIEALLGVNPPEHELSALRDIISVFPRFTALELRGVVPAKIMPKNGVHFPALQSVLIEGRWWLRDSGLNLQKAPGLRSLTLCGMPALSSNSNRRYHDLRVCWTSITALDISQIGANTIHFQDLMRILRLTTHLSSLAISGASIILQADRWDEEWIQAVVTLASLRCLQMNIHPSGSGVSGPLELREFLSQLCTPNLRTLVTDVSIPTAGNTILSFIQRSGVATNLTSLTISIGICVLTDLVARRADISSLFPELQGLRYLHVHGRDGNSYDQQDRVVPALLQILTWPTGDHTVVGTSGEPARVCPDLEEVHWLTGWKTVLDVPWFGLRSLVQSRIAHTPQQRLNDAPNPIDIARIPDYHKPETKRSGIHVLSLMELSREMGGKVLEKMHDENRRSMRWLIDADMSGVFKLRLQDIESKE